MAIACTLHPFEAVGVMTSVSNMLLGGHLGAKPEFEAGFGQSV
jgi:hypothetical protein